MNVCIGAHGLKPKSILWQTSVVLKLDIVPYPVGDNVVICMTDQVGNIVFSLQ
jgi:hypothetical protein